MPNEIKKILETLSAGKHLKREESQRAFQIMLTAGATPAQIAAILIALKMNGESENEIAGAVDVIRSKLNKFNVSDDIKERMIDTCGTGGDASGTYNISTAVSFVVAACGVPVAKHGNRAVSSKSGSADVLEKLGVKIDVDQKVMEEALEKFGICFMMAPLYHKAMRHVGPIRQELGTRTIFNILGPLSNPAGAKRQLLGVYSRDLTEKMAHVLQSLGTEHAWVVHGLDGLDEITITDKTYVSELKDGRVNNFVIDPEDYDIEQATLESLKGGDADDNTKALLDVLSGENNAYRDVISINAAAALLIGGKAADLNEGIKMAHEAIDSQKAKETLRQFAAFTQDA